MALSPIPDAATTDSSAQRLRSFVERIERLESDKADVVADIKDLYTEVKSAGFEPKIVRQIVRLRKMDADARQEQEFLLEAYQKALGMLSGTPLGNAALRAVS